jgi:hypothetical protein
MRLEKLIACRTFGVGVGVGVGAGAALTGISLSKTWVD